ncbi:ABC transporter substrate-binding protein [Phreatobacter stygius]|uniref:ABC transporter substrate-binding protein n=1 Tax=Phreatobacter stygius TaxID=1940610 RepID=UPI0014775183|nr:ABC transporter substrate-binding protein [Phreatobacter stygius]
MVERVSVSRARLRAVLSASLVALGLLGAATVPAAAQARVKVLLDWAWLPYHAPFLIAEERGFYREAGLAVSLEQGRGSATTALLLSQGGFDIAHLNITNATQMIGRGGSIRIIGLYQHRTAAAFIGIRGRVKLDGPRSLRGLKIGSTPGGSDALSLRIFMRANGMGPTDLNVVSLDSNAKTTALFGGSIDVVSGDSPAFDAYVRATGQQPETLQLADAGVPLLGFGFAANTAFLGRNPELVRQFLAASRRGFVEAARDPQAACELIRTKVHLAGTVERCVDYFKGLMALSTAPTDPGWGRMSEAEWNQLVRTLQAVGELPADVQAAQYYTNDFVPQ